MLRLIALLLLLLNVTYLAWSEGLLPILPVEQQGEPQRLQQQIKPGAIRLLSSQEQQQLESARAPAEQAD